MKFFVISMFLFTSCVLFAQQDKDEDKDKKKPSWSTGLPERTAAPTLNKPSTDIGKPDFGVAEPDNSSMPATDMSLDNELSEGFALPEITIDTNLPVASQQKTTKSHQAVTSDSSDLKVEEKTVDEAVVESQAAITEPNADISDRVSETLIGTSGNLSPADYDWELVEMVPVKIPRSMSYSYKEVTLEVHINPQGEVVTVKRMSDLTSNKLLNYSLKAMKNWRFRPPADYGIDEVISKAILVELVPR